MKKINLLIFTFISLFVFMGNVFADGSIECSGGGVTCTFTSKSGNLNGTCKNSAGKSYTPMNLNGHLDNKQNMSDAIGNYSHQDVSSCPAYMLVDDTEKSVIFVGSGSTYVACPYAVEILGKTNLTCDSYEPNKPMVSATLAQTIDYLNLVGEQLGTGTNYKSYSVTTGTSQVGSDCDSQLQLLYDKVVDKQTNVKNANCGYDLSKDNCKSLMEDWKKEISSAKNSASFLKQAGTCTQAQIDTFNKRIGEETEDYNLTEQSRKDIGEKGNKTDDSSIDLVDDGCGGVFGDPEDPNYIAYYLQLIFNIIKFLGPVLVIVMSIIDLLKVTAEQKQDGELEKLGSKTFKRLIYAVIIFVLPTLINYIFGLIGLYGTCGIS